MSGVVDGRSLGLTAAALAAVAGMVWLGLWQYGAYDDHRSDDSAAALARPPIPLDQALGADAAFPSDSVSRPVTLTGRYLAAEQFYVSGMAGAGDGYAVVTPVVTSTGSAILVVRGASATRDDAAAPSGPVRVTGVLEPSDDSAAPLDAQRTTDAIQIARLVPSFDEDLYAGYVVATSADPTERLSPVVPPRAKPSFWAGLRNLLYALQWWCFAAFAVFLWWRMVTEPPTADDHADEPEDRAAERAEPVG